MTHPTVQVQPNSQITDTSLTEKQRPEDDHLSTSLRFFDLPLGIGPKVREPPFYDHYVSAYTWVWTHALCVPRQVCYLLGHSGKLRAE